MRVDSAKDLGVSSYRFRKGLGWIDLAGRFDEGCRRLHRIAQEMRDAQQKARLVQSGVWPQALYGHESQLMPLGKVEKLRAAAARAVWGKARSLSVAIAMSTGYGGMQDPEVYLMHGAIVALQRLLRVWPELGRKNWQLAVRFSDQPGRPFGPATTLARLANRNGWTLQSNVILKGPGLETIDLATSTSRDVRSSLERSWQAVLYQKVAHRQGLHSFNALDVDVFRGVCRELGPQAVGALGRVFFGGFHSKASDTKWHRIFECPAHAEMRRPFLPVLDWVRQNAPHWPYCAIPEQHKDVGVLRLIWGSRKVDPNPPPVSLILSFSLNKCVMYTDGTCANNDCPAARHAAFAIVLDCSPDSGSQAQLLYWQAEQRVPPNFHVVHQGLVPGRQSIDRAELLALLHVCKYAQALPDLTFEAVTDSQYALEAVQSWDLDRVRQGQPLPTNFDLFAAFELASKPPNLQLRKVKSHQDPTTAPLEEVRHVLGNMAADVAAANARRQEFACVLDVVGEVAQWHKTSKEAFELYCCYNQELTKAVALRDQNARTTGLDAAGFAKPDPTEADLALQWLRSSTGGPNAVPPLEFPSHWPTTGQGPQRFLASSWVWRNGIRWPEQVVGRQHRGEGITFFELLVNFVVTTRSLPPIKSHDSGILCDPLSSSGILSPVGTRELVANMTSAADFLGRACGVAFWPVPRHHRIYSLVTLHEANPRKGLRQRPGLQNEESTARLLARMLKNSSQAEILREAALQGTV